MARLALCQPEAIALNVHAHIPAVKYLDFDNNLKAIYIPLYEMVSIISKRVKKNNLTFYWITLE